MKKVKILIWAILLTILVVPLKTSAIALNKNSHYNESKKNEKSVPPAITAPAAQTLTWKDGLNITSVSLPSGWYFLGGSSTLKMGTAKYDVVYKPSAAEKKKYDYTGVNLVKTITITVVKGQPSYKTPGNITVTQGQNLTNSMLPSASNGSFSWSSTSISGSGTYYCTFTPKDTEHYETVSNIPVNVNVKTTEAKIVATESVVATEEVIDENTEAEEKETTEKKKKEKKTSVSDKSLDDIVIEGEADEETGLKVRPAASTQEPVTESLASLSTSVVDTTQSNNVEDESVDVETEETINESEQLENVQDDGSRTRALIIVWVFIIVIVAAIIIFVRKNFKED